MNEIKSRLLVLDDESNMRLSLAKLLELEGFEVVTVGTVKEALEILDSLFFDVVITDLVLPDGNGLDVLKYCTEYCRKTKVICITGQASTDSAIKALRLGAHDYVTKPFNFDMLLHSINSVLEKMYMEEAIGLEREKYRALIDDLKDGYFVLEGGKIVYTNNAMASMVGFSTAELKGKEFSELANSDAKVAKAFDAFESAEIGTWHDDLVFTDRSGNEIPVDVKLSIAHGSDRRDLLVGIAREITERDVLWDRLVKAEKLALMGEMVAGIAHELNNKLTPILGFVELLRNEVQDERSQTKMTAVHNAALGARKIVQSLLTFARKEKPRKKLIDINRIVDSSLTMVQSSFATTRIRVVKKLQPDIYPVKVDSAQIEQVLVNLFKNGFEAMGDSGELTVQTLGADNNVVIKVSDTGKGIPEEIRERVFTPFFTTKEDQGGTGLGLSICHGIITSHDGDITMHSGSDGTTFVITLPACPEMEVIEPFSAQGHDETPSTYKQSRGSILVIDDEPEIRKLLRELFRDDFELDVVNNGREALNRLKVKDYDLLISDIKMPLLDGIELYDMLKTGYPQYLERIIYTTGVTFDSATSSFLEETGVPYLAKPFKILQLVEMVNDMMAELAPASNAAA